MILNKCIFQWFSIDVTTRSHFFPCAPHPLLSQSYPLQSWGTRPKGVRLAPSYKIRLFCFGSLDGLMDDIVLSTVFKFKNKYYLFYCRILNTDSFQFHIHNFWIFEIFDLILVLWQKISNCSLRTDTSFVKIRFKKTDKEPKQAVLWSSGFVFYHTTPWKNGL